jgi:hypothetical protein
MTKNDNIIKNFIYQLLTLTNNLNIKKSFVSRYLQDSSENSLQKEENQKKQIIELLIYLTILFSIIIVILVGFSLYKKYLEKKALREILRENENIQNSISAASQDERNIYSFNYKIYDKNNKYIGSELESNNAVNNSFDYNHEERLEKIRKKYGNKMIIKILIKQYIEKVIYNKNLGLEYGDNCTICVNNFLENIEIYRTHCEHIFHKECLNKYLKKVSKKNKLTCPNCNQNLLINKKFLKHRNENEKIKIKNKKINIKIQNLNININQIQNNVDNIDIIETDKKRIIDIDEVLTTVKNNADDNIIKNTNDSIDNNKNEIIIIKKRKKEFIPKSRKKHSMTIENKNNDINIYYPNENIIKSNKTKNNEDILYIYNSDKISEKSYKDSAKSFDNNNEEKIDLDIINSKSVKDIKKKKATIEKIKFSDVENDFIDNNKNLSELNSNRKLVDKKQFTNI